MAAVLSLMVAGVGHAQSASGGQNLSAARQADTSSTRASDAELTGTILSTDAAGARTIITDGHGRQRVYAVGDDIAGGGEVVEIHAYYVVVRRGGGLQRLDFSRSAPSRRFGHRTPDAGHAMSSGKYPTVLRRAMFGQPGLLLELLGATAVVEDGHFLGYRVTRPENPSFIESLGLKAGDMLTAVNGVPLDTPDYGTKALEALAGSGKLTYTVRRGNQVLVLDH